MELISNLLLCLLCFSLSHSRHLEVSCGEQFLNFGFLYFVWTGPILKLWFPSFPYYNLALIRSMVLATNVVFNFLTFIYDNLMKNVTKCQKKILYQKIVHSVELTKNLMFCFPIAFRGKCKLISCLCGLLVIDIETNPETSDLTWHIHFSHIDSVYAYRKTLVPNILLIPAHSLRNV